MSDVQRSSRFTPGKETPDYRWMEG